MREEAERAEPIIQRDDDGAFASEAVAGVTRLGARASGEAAAVQPNHDGPAIVGRRGRRPNVQVEAVLAGRWRVRVLPTAALSAAGRVFRGGPHFRPLRDGLRRTPAVFTDGRRSERDAFEDSNLGVRAGRAGE